MTNFKRRYKNKKVLVTGGGGLIGSAFIRRLSEYGARVRTVRHSRPVPFEDIEIVEGDLLDFETCERACEGVEIVIHAAGVSGGSKKVTYAGIPMFTDNLLMNTQMLEAARLAGVKEYLFVSNSSVYPQSVEPLREEFAYSGVPENETGMVKRAGETQCGLYAKFSDMRIAVMRAGNAYGPYDNFDPESSHVVAAIIRKAVEKQNPFTIWGDGTPLRDFIYADDIADGGLFLLANYPTAEAVNIASGRTVTIRQLVELILKIAEHSDHKLEFQNAAPPASAAKIIDVRKMKKLGFQPGYTLEKGLSKTIEWYLENGGGK